MRISVQIDSAAAQAQLRRLGGEFRDKVKKAVSRAIASEAVELKQDVRSHVASQRPTGARHRVVCQANAAPVTVEVDATEVEPFMAFPGVSDKVRRTQRVRV